MVRARGGGLSEPFMLKNRDPRIAHDKVLITGPRLLFFD